jgi:hypothetical protein
MRLNGKKLIRFAGIGCLVLGIFWYAFFEARSFLQGPSLSVLSPQDGFATTSEQISVSGTTAHITEILLDGRPISVDETGAFRQDVLLSPGYTVVTLKVTDRYGRTQSATRSGLYTPAKPEATAPPASSTPAETTPE